MTSTETSSTMRRLAIGGIIGPSTFVAAWAIGAFTNDRQLDVVDDAISQLAHVESNTRWLMSVGFVTFGVGVGSFAISVRRTLGLPTAAMLGATAASTLLVALLPLGASDVIDRLHGIAAGAGYVTLVAAPLAARAPLRRIGARRMANAGVVAAGIAAISLAASLTTSATGAFQRTGLTVIDAWIVALAAAIVTGRLGSGTHAPTEQ